MSNTAHTQSLGDDLDHNARSLRAVYGQLSALIGNMPADPAATDASGDELGAIYAFCSARSQSGTSYVARNMAINAAQMINEQSNVDGSNVQGMPDTNNRVLLIDLDIGANTHSTWFFNQAQSLGQALPHGPYDATFSQLPFWRVTPSMVNDQGQNITDTHFMSLHMMHDIPLSFLHFQWDLFRQGQAVHIQNSRQYWHELRRQYRAVFVDIPAQDRSSLLNSIALDADTNVIVTSPEQSQTSEIDDLSNHLSSLGANCAGVVVNQIPDHIHGDTMPVGDPS